MARPAVAVVGVWRVPSILVRSAQPLGHADLQRAITLVRCLEGLYLLICRQLKALRLRFVIHLGRILIVFNALFVQLLLTSVEIGLRSRIGHELLGHGLVGGARN